MVEDIEELKKVVRSNENGTANEYTKLDNRLSQV